MTEALVLRGHTVYQAYSVNDAKSYWTSQSIDCLIVDSNMVTDGLSPEEVEQTHDGMLTGWIWLHNYVLKENEKMRNRTIIYTEYMSDLLALVPDSELKGIHLVAKKGPNSPAAEIKKIVESIAQNIGKSK
jgi:hypothetical protein